MSNCFVGLKQQILKFNFLYKNQFKSEKRSYFLNSHNGYESLLSEKSVNSSYLKYLAHHQKLNLP